MSDSADRVRERAIAFVLEQGDEFERHAVPAFAAVRDVAALETWLAAGQRPDGGFPPDATPAAARRAIGALADVGALETPPVERACRFLTLKRTA